jgi:uncharacterized protein with FMN-binding domain
MKQGGSNKKVANSLVAVSCGAVLAVYTAGYARTRSAADRLDAQTVERRAAAISDPARSTAALTEMPREAAGRGERETPAALTSSRAIHEEAGRRSLIPLTEPAPAAIEIPAETTGLPAPPAPVAPPVVASVVLPANPAPIPEPKAEVVAVAPAAPNVPAAPKWKDGTYYGWGTSRHGDIQAEVVIEGGRIASATIAQCRTRYPCSVIDPLPPQVAQRQSPEVDYISRATQSTNAFYYGVVEALSKAK